MRDVSSGHRKAVACMDIDQSEERLYVFVYICLIGSLLSVSADKTIGLFDTTPHLDGRKNVKV